MRLRAGQRPTWARSVVAIVVLAAGVTLLTYRPSAQMFADREFLDLAWHAYKDLYIDPAGYVLDRDRNGGEVTSEGQAYALMRAAWMGDHETFTSVLEWTDRTLRRPDGLYSWHWTPRDNGTLLDRNTATDADQDIAFALVLAFHHFEDRTYLERARALLVAIRSQTGIELPNGWFPSAGNWAVPERIVNLSYFTPYAYPYFDRIDPEGDGWRRWRRGMPCYPGRSMTERPGCHPTSWLWGQVATHGHFRRTARWVGGFRSTPSASCGESRSTAGCMAAPRPARSPGVSRRFLTSCGAAGDSSLATTWRVNR